MRPRTSDINKRILILGAGPTGLGAAYRFSELGYENWALYEMSDKVGGLSASFVDDQGFTWDIGGHVMFSNQPYFNQLVDRLLSDRFLSHDRESWIRMRNSWVPYPFQNNIRYLPGETVLQCLLGLINAKGNTQELRHFEDWIYRTFGDGIAQHFMIPYNFKVWATPASLMAYDWIAERVSVISIERVLKNVIMNQDDTGWGPNNKFKFPLHGGTGGLFNAFIPSVEHNLHLNKKCVFVDLDNRTTSFSDGTRDSFDAIINTLPLDIFVSMLRTKNGLPAEIGEKAGLLKHNGVYVIGIGLRKKIVSTKCWVYFPEEDIPFYRMTYFSHYSPNNVPAGDTATYSSLMCEVSFSEHKQVSQATVVERTIDGLVKGGIILESDRSNIVSTWLRREEYGYPIPTLGRNDVLHTIQPFLERHNILSRGRFGAWKYEIGNMDHSVMMGGEAADRLMTGKQETLWSL